MAVNASIEDVAHVECHMRAGDVAELEAIGQGRAGIWNAYRASSHAYGLHLNDELVMVYGVIPASVLGGSGMIWALGTDGVTRHAKQFLKDSPNCLRECFDTYNHLYNWVDERNTASKRWLKWLGFELQEAKPFGPLGMPFHRFDMRV